MSANLFIISAASGTGKTSLVAELLKSMSQLTVSTSHTTRAPRPGERDGVHYHFTDVSSFKERIQNGDFLEHAQVFENYYGTALSTVQQLLADDQDVILEIDWQGALQVQKRMPGAISVFILPPSIDALRARLRSRAQDTDEVIEKRLSGAMHEMSQHRHFDYVVINDDFDVALADLQSIVRTTRLTLARQDQKHAALIHKLVG